MSTLAHTADSDWTIALRTALVATAAIAVKAAGAAKTIVIARYFPPGAELDAFLLAFLVPSFLGDVLAGALNPTLVPALVEARQHRAQASLYAWTLYRALALLTIVAAVLTLIALALAPKHLTARLLLLLAPMLPFTAFTNTWRSLLHAHNRFTLASSAPLLTPVATILALLFAARAWGIYALPIGTILGSLAELALLGYAVRALGHRCLPRPIRHHPQAALLHTQYRSLAANNVVLGASLVIDQTFAATLGSGSLSILNFGTRLSGVLLAIGPSTISTTLLPSLSEFSRDRARLRRALIRYLFAGAALAVPLTLALIAFSEPLVRIIFHRGALSTADTTLVARVQSCALLQLPFSFVLAILTRTLAALRASEVLLPLSLGALVLNLAADYLLMRSFGVAGIALSTALVHATLSAVLATLLFRRLAR